MCSLIFHKYAEVPPPLTDYQKRVVERLLDPANKGLLVAHGVGTGKTRTAIESIRQLNQPADIVAPAALIPNWRKELNRWNAEDLPVTFHTLEKLQRENPESLNEPVLVVDEVHRLRNKRKAYQALLQSLAKKKVLLSGTPMINKPSDILPPLKLINEDKKLTMGGKAFNSIIDDAVSDIPAEPIATTTQQTAKDKKVKYNDLDEFGKRRRRQQIIDTLKKYVDMHMEPPKDMPSYSVQDVVVNQNKRQSVLLAALRGWLDEKSLEKLKETLAPHRQSLEKLRAFRIGERQLANGDPGMMRGQSSPKMDQAVKNFINAYKENKKHKAIVYSNFINAGLDLYKKELAKAGIPYGEFSGRIPRKERYQTINEYNDDKLNALLISGAGAEGLNLKGTNAVHIIEPHFNESRSQQAMARGIRKGSHNHLPQSLRNVDVMRYYLKDPKEETADIIVGNMAQNKQKSINYLLNTLGKTTTEEP
jgi:SNF2 family DNA or RNA helicase